MHYPSALRRSLALLTTAGAVALLAGCAGVNVQEYQHTQPQFTLKQFFNGPIMATGVFRDRSGKVVRRFHARLHGQWEDDNGTLSEHFDYVGDHPDAARVWHLMQQDIHHFTGTGQGSAGDIVGTARGEGYGYALHWSYDVDLPTGDTTHQVHFNDRMWMVDPDTVIDHSIVTKYGFTVGTLNMVMQKIDPATGKVLQATSMKEDNSMQHGQGKNADSSGKSGDGTHADNSGKRGNGNKDGGGPQTFGFK